MRRAYIGWAAAFMIGLGGCGVQLPSEYPLSEYTRVELLGKANVSAEDADKVFDLPGGVQGKIADILVEQFGTPDDPGMRAQFMSDAEYASVYEGSILYHQHCIHCHGLTGAGNGPTAPFLFPRPRDYRKGLFKWKSTERNAKPTRADLLAVLRDGAMGSSMPPFRLMPEKELNQLVDYVIFLSKRGEIERRLLLQYDSTEELPDAGTVAEWIAELNGAWAAADQTVVQPGEPKPALSDDSAAYEASLQRGKQLYLSEKAACYKCHNNDGRADPAKMAEKEREQNVDDWGNPNYPRNLLLGMFRGGRRPIDLYRRIHQGIAGASMPAGGTNLKPQEIWDLVHLVRAVPYRKDLLEEPKAEKDSHGHGAHGSHGGH